MSLTTSTRTRATTPEPSLAVAVSVADPLPTPVTVPSAATVATSVFEDVQVTLLSVASSGFTVVVRRRTSPASISKDVRLRVMDSTGTVTVTSQVALTDPAVAVIVAVPAATAVTVPSESTVATSVFEDVQVTRSVVSDGSTVAVSCTVFSTNRETSVSSSEIAVAGTVEFWNVRPLSSANCSAVDPSRPRTTSVCDTWPVEEKAMTWMLTRLSGSVTTASELQPTNR